MTRPPPDDRRRPLPRDGANVEATEADSSIVRVSSDSLESAAQEAGFGAWYAQFRADCIVGLEALAQNALRALSTEQLESMRWVGQNDTGWSQMHDELTRRGESL